MDKTACELILPEGTLQYFDVDSVNKLPDHYSIHLVEKPLLPAEFSNLQLESNRFYEQITIKDFPLRGKACYLHVKRRRWIDKNLSKTASRDWKLLAHSTRLTK